MNRSALRGVSLIEALVALAVMAFGMLGIVALQSTMRQNADVSKQRSEAVRIGQQEVERLRGFTTTGLPLNNRYVNIVSGSLPIDGLNATYTRTVTVTPGATPDSKTVVVDVAWQDRTGAAQSVRLSTAITGIVPELAGAIGLPAFGSPTRLPEGRHAAIPPAAVDQGDGTSLFQPPGAGPIEWRFENATGHITEVCTSGVCTTLRARLLAGFVGFETGTTQPTPAMAENPTGTASPVEVTVQTTFPTTATVACFEELATTVVAYFCAVPVEALSGNKWSGRSLLASATPIASTIADTAPANLKICRYTPVRGCHPTVGSDVWGTPSTTGSCSGSAPTPKRVFTNAEHPLDYTDVTDSLVNQNFLAIRSGDGTTAFACPDDDPATPLINGNTWHHQPAS